MRLPASKSISNRALIISALAGGRKLSPTNVSVCDDTFVMQRALGDLTASSYDIMAAGTAMRFLTAFMAVSKGERELTGSERMRHRPISVLVDALRRLGADIDYAQEEGYPPLKIRGRQLAGGDLWLPGDVSSQYVSALLMIGPVLERGLRLTLTEGVASRPYIDMTLSLMRSYGAEAAWEDERSIRIEPTGYRPTLYNIENDWSAASYWYEMVALSADPAASIELPGLHAESTQGDQAVSELFRALGVRTDYTNEGVRLSKCERQRETVYERDLLEQPDLAQTIVVTCCLLGQAFRLSGLQSLRIKETDRIAALETELAKWGYRVEHDADCTLSSDARRREGKAAAIDTYEDHRMAMAFAPGALRLSDVRINHPEVVSKSYPDYWQHLRQVGFVIKEEQSSF